MRWKLMAGQFVGSGIKRELMKRLVDTAIYLSRLRPMRRPDHNGYRTRRREDIWMDRGRGAFHFQAANHRAFHLRRNRRRFAADHISASSVDAEEVVWFATDKGSCRYDPHATRAEIFLKIPRRIIAGALAPHFARAAVGVLTGCFVYETEHINWLRFRSSGAHLYALTKKRMARVLVAHGHWTFAAGPELVFAPAGRQNTFKEGCAQSRLARRTYVATYGVGVEKFRERARTGWRRHVEAHLREVLSLSIEANGRLLIGTQRRLFFFDEKQTTTDAVAGSLKNYRFAFAPEAKGMWLASRHIQARTTEEIAGALMPPNHQCRDNSRMVIRLVRHRGQRSVTCRS